MQVSGHQQIKQLMIYEERKTSDVTTVNQQIIRHMNALLYAGNAYINMLQKTATNVKETRET